MARSASMGFSTEGIQKVTEGYLVEGDIILTENNLNSPASFRLGKRRTLPYNNTVTGLPRNITVAVTTTAPSYFFTATDAAIARYNAENLQLHFTRITQNANNNAANINVVVFYR